MKVYSYRTFESSRNSKIFPNKGSSSFTPKTKGKNFFNLDLSFLPNQSFLFQVISLCLLTVGLLLGFQTLSDNAEVNALASASSNDTIRALNNFGKNLKPSDSLDLKEIIAENPEMQSESIENTDPVVEVETQTITYTVKAGDNLYSIAMQYDKDFTEIAEDNGLSRPYNLQIGQQLYINL